MKEYFGDTDPIRVERRIHSLIGMAEWTLTTALKPWEARKARRLLVHERPVRLHLGCGSLYKPGWINTDIATPTWALRLARPTAATLGWISRDSAYPVSHADLRWDLRRPLPFPINSVHAIFAEHVLEHFTYAKGIGILEDCHRVLAPGGVLRLGLPDLERYVRGYMGVDAVLDEQRSGRPTRAIALSELFYRHGHRAAYDSETLLLACREAGFSCVETSAFGQGRLGAEADSESRRADTVYIEAAK